MRTLLYMDGTDKKPSNTQAVHLARFKIHIYYILGLSDMAQK